MINNPHILIANSSPWARERLRETLGDAGFRQISEADTDLAVIEILTNQPIDVLITDIPLGRLDGWRLTRLVRSGALAAAPDIPVLMVSATYSERIAEITAKEFEVDRFINFDELETLPDAIRDVMSGSTGIKKSTLLVIEDNPDTTEIIKRILQKRFDIETVADGEAGIEAWKARRHDLVLLDMMLPKIPGDQVLSQILKILPNQTVVVMTAFGSAERAGTLVLNGAADFIAKPFRAEQLRRVCEIAVHREDFMVSNEQFARQLAELRKKEERYRRLVEALSEDHFFYTCDTKGSFSYLSPSITNVLGYSEEEFLEKHASSLTENPINRMAERLRDLGTRGKQQYPYEIEILHKDGNIHRLEATESPVFDAKGNVVGVDGIAHDVTARVHMQDQLRQAQKMEAIGQLTGGIAHDFNNILGSILGYTGLAQEKFASGTDNKLGEYLSEVYSAGERARDLIAQMLAFSRGGTSAPQPMIMTPLVKEGIKMLRSTVPTSIELSTKLADQLPVVMMDPVQLHQLIMNLCINARDAIEGERGRIDVQLEYVSGIKANCGSCHLPVTGSFVELSVTDNGHGIDEKILSRIFDPFFTTKDVGKGSGMGLSMVHGIVHEHGGHVLVESEPGMGTTFRLLFPALQEDTESVSNNGLDRQRVTGSGRVLVVDDDPVLSKYLGELLEDRGYQVTALTDPQEALKLFERDPAGIDLLLTDQTMPGLSGDMLAKEILNRRPDLPVILCTGYSEKIDEAKARQSNIRGFLIKPVDPERLTGLMASLLASSRDRAGA